MVQCVFQMVHDGTQGEASDALRIRYAPRAEILGDARVSAFFLPVSTIKRTIVAF